MIQHFKTALCAAVALCAASPASAATYVTYTIGGTATSIFPGPVAWFIAEFTVPIDQIRGGGTFYDMINSSRVGFGNTSIGINSTGLTFRQQGRVRSDSLLSFNACTTTPFSTLPVTAGRITIDASCSTASIVIEGVPGYEYINSSGRVDSLVVSTSDIAPFSFGLSSFVLAVPEPSTWALMLAGFGMVGYAIRRRRPLVAFE